MAANSDGSIYPEPVDFSGDNSVIRQPLVIHIKTPSANSDKMTSSHGDDSLSSNLMTSFRKPQRGMASFGDTDRTRREGGSTNDAIDTTRPAVYDVTGDAVQTPAPSGEPYAPGRRSTDDTCSDQSRTKLIECFINLLDDWAWNMWEIRQNLADLNCSLHADMDSCLVSSGCSMAAAVEFSTTLTELLIYSKSPQSFLYSFLALEFACKPEGQDVLEEPQGAECLHKYHEGMHMLLEIDDIQDKMKAATAPAATTDGAVPEAAAAPKSNEELCTLLKERSDVMRSSALTECGSEAVALLVCQSVINPFLRINETVFADCKDTLCPKPPEATVTDMETATMLGEQNDPNAARLRGRISVLTAIVVSGALIFGV